MPRKYYRLLTRVHISFFSCFHQSVVNDSSFSVLLLKCYLSHQSFQQIALFSIHARCLKLTTKLIEVPDNTLVQSGMLQTKNLQDSVPLKYEMHS